MTFSFSPTKAFFIISLFASVTFSANAQDTIQKRSSVTLAGYTASFTDINGYAVAAGYQYKLNRYLTLEGNISHASGNTFPDRLEDQSGDVENIKPGWETKTSIENIAACVHFSAINNKHHYLSVFGGIGSMWVDSSDYIVITSRLYDQNGNVVAASASYYLYAEKKNFVSKNYGIQYKYTFNNGFQVGADVRGVSPLGKNSFLGQPDYLSAGVLIGKAF